MARMTARERWLAVLAHELPDRIPMDFQGTPELIQKMLRYLGVSSVEEMYSYLHVDYPVGVGPAYCGPPIPDGADMYRNRFHAMDYGDGVYEECVFHALAQYQTIEEIEEKYTWPSADWFDYSVIPGQFAGNEDHPIMAGLAGIYTLYTWLRGMEQAFIDFAINHELVLYCIGKLYDMHFEKAVRTFEAAKGKIDIGSIANDMGSQIDLLYSLPTIRKLFLPGIRRLAELTHQNGAYVYLHSDGAIRKALPDLIAAGVDIFNPVQWRCKGMDRLELKRDFGDRLVFHGGVDNQYTIPYGSVEEVKAEVKTNIETLGAGGGYILAPCHAFQTVSPPQNVVALYEAGHEYGRYEQA
jgi:uroporphyrinogen decarboxylase